MKTNKKLMNIPDFMIVIKRIGEKPNISITDLHLDTQVSYAHILNIINILCEENFVITQKIGKLNKVNLTEKGKNLKKNIVELFNELGINENNILDFRAKTKHREKNIQLETEQTNVLVQNVVESETQEEIPEEISEEIPEEISEEIPEEISEEIPEEILEDNINEELLQEEIPEEILEDVVSEEEIPEEEVETNGDENIKT